MNDLISRQDAIDAVNDLTYPSSLVDVKRKLVQLPSVQPKILACGEGELNVPETNASDMISRQAAIDALRDEYHGMISDESMKIYQIIDWLFELPSVQPERKKGKWIRLSNDLAQCSECKDYIDNAIRCGYNYCPNCGKNMRGENNE